MAAPAPDRCGRSNALLLLFLLTTDSNAQELLGSHNAEIGSSSTHISIELKREHCAKLRDSATAGTLVLRGFHSAGSSGVYRVAALVRDAGGLSGQWSVIGEFNLFSMRNVSFEIEPIVLRSAARDCTLQLEVTRLSTMAPQESVTISNVEVWLR
jgi:hypothetical protein